MLSKKDKEEIKQIFKECFKEAFKREALMEFKPQKPGDPPAYVEKRVIDVLDEIVSYLPFLEGAIRGCQVDAAKARNKSIEVRDLIISLLPDETKDIKRITHIEKPEIKKITEGAE